MIPENLHDVRSTPIPRRSGRLDIFFRSSTHFTQPAKTFQTGSQCDDVRLVRRITVFIDLLMHQVPVAVLCERWGLSSACLSAWQKAFLLRGIDRLVSGHRGGRRPQLSPRQQQRWVELIEAGPLVVGCETACWTSVL